ncbi:hypothetical protein FA95DRAFT_1505077, partial [Auriscalpium vulgare]
MEANPQSKLKSDPVQLVLDSTPPNISEGDGLAEIDAKRLELEAAIRKLQDEHRALGTQHNELISVSRLPKEILSRIFFFC